MQDHCGTCQDCIDVCPTRAIVAPYVLDARLCISYLTIELKGAIPRHLRPLMGSHIFGCDDCQEVCPWNKKARLPVEFLRDLPVSELIHYLSLTPQEFNQQFKQSPIKRAKRRGFLRNVCVALGNLKNPLAIASLQKALLDEEPLIRAHAAWALGQYELEEMREILKQQHQVEKVDYVKEEIEWAIHDFLHL